MKHMVRSSLALLLVFLMLFGSMGVALAANGPQPQADTVISTTDPAATPDPEVAKDPAATPDAEVTKDSEATPDPEVTENPEATPDPEPTETPDALPGAPEDALLRAFGAKAPPTGHRVLVSGSGLDRIAIRDYNGDVIWQLPQAEFGWNEVNDAELLPNGNVVFAVHNYSGESYVALLRPEYPNETGYELLWRYDVPAGGENHTVQAINDNGFLVAECYPNVLRIVELDAGGNVRKEFNAPEAFNAPANDTHNKLRQAHKNDDGTYLLSHFSQPFTMLLNADGTIKTQYEVGRGFTAVPDGKGNIIIAGGDTHIITCLNATTGEEVWKVNQSDISGVSLGFVAAVEPLENGNLVLANWGGHGGASGASVMEINPTAKTLVWSLANEGSSVSNVQVLDGMFDVNTEDDDDDFYQPVIDPEIPTHEPDRYRSPLDATASILTGLVYVADYTDQTISVIRSATDKVIKVIELPDAPNAILLSADAKTLYVAAGGIEGKVYAVDTATNLVLETVYAVGHTPSALALDGETLYVANRFGGTLQKIDLTAKVVGEPVHVTREPMAMKLTGGKLYVGGHLPVGAVNAGNVSAQIVPVNPATLAPGTPILMVNGSTALKDLAVSPDGEYLYATHTVGRYNVATTHGDRGWIYTNAVSEIRLSDDTLVATMLVDDLDKGVSNPWGIEATTDKLVLTASGTRELVIINRTLMRERIDAIADGSGVMTGFLDTTADIANDLTFLTPFKTRIDLGEDSPRGLALLGGKAYTANYHGGSVSVYNINTGSLKTIMLDSTKAEDNIRAGERLWNDATYGFQQWQSCASCHPDARVDALNWDNLNDGIGTPKQARTMVDTWTRGRVMATGIRPSGHAAVRAGIKYIMFNGAYITENADEVEQLDAYVASLTPEYSPYLEDGKLSESALRGEALFNGEASCAGCHSGPSKGQDKLIYANYTDEEVDTRGLLVPPLNEVWRTAPYLHDGSAATIMDVLTTRNVSGTHGNLKDLTPEELKDLEEYVFSIGPVLGEAPLLSIGGTVSTALQGVSVEGLTVGLYTTSDTSFATPITTALTEAGGTYLLSGLSAGTYVIRIAGVPESYAECVKLVTANSSLSAVGLTLRAESEDTYAITVTAVDGATVTPSLETAKAGALITLTVEVTDPEKTVGTVIVDLAGEDNDYPAIKTGEGAYSFVMPNEAVAVTVTLTSLQTLVEAAAAVETAMAEYQATNTTTVAALETVAAQAITNPGITITLSEFAKNDAVVGSAGSVSAKITLTLAGGASQEVAVSLSIDPLPAEPDPTPPAPSRPRPPITNDSIIGSTVIKPGMTVENGAAVGNLNSSDLNRLVEQVKSSGNDRVVIRAENTKDAGKVTVNLASGGAARLGKETAADLTLETGAGSVTIRNADLKTISGSIAISFETRPDGSFGVDNSKNAPMLAALPGTELVPGSVAVIINEDGTDTVLGKSYAKDGLMLAAIQGNVVLKIMDNSKFFTDVTAGWYKDGVAFVTSRELFGGTGTGVFSPEVNMNRAMLATVLHRLEGKPAGAPNTDLTDVAANTWYTESVAWAAQLGIAKGQGGGRFNPDAAVTRQEMAVMLYNYAKAYGYVAEVGSAALSAADADQVADWAEEAMAYAVSNGLITGKPGNLLDPTGTAVRAEVALLLQRFVENCIY